VCGCIDATSHAARVSQARRNETLHELLGNGSTVRCGSPSADDTDGVTTEKIGVALGVEQDGRVGDLFEQLGVTRVLEGDDRNALVRGKAQFVCGIFEVQTGVDRLSRYPTQLRQGNLEVEERRVEYSFGVSEDAYKSNCVPGSKPRS
jgi:hypothetical protein